MLHAQGIENMHINFESETIWEISDNIKIDIKEICPDGAD
jgi:hypothetical protein